MVFILALRYKEQKERFLYNFQEHRENRELIDFPGFFFSTTLIHVYLQLSNLLNFQVQMDYFFNTSGDSDEEDVICPSGIFNLSRCGVMKRSNHFPPEQIPKRRQISRNESSKCVRKTFPRV